MIAVLVLPLLTAVGTLLCRTARQADAVNVAGALATAGGALALAAIERQSSAARSPPGPASA